MRQGAADLSSGFGARITVDAAPADWRGVGMLITVAMKAPDTLHDAIKDAVEASVANITDEDERAAIAEVRREKAAEVCGKWFQYSEYLQVEIDTDAKTIRVCPASEF